MPSCTVTEPPSDPRSAFDKLLVLALYFCRHFVWMYYQYLSAPQGQTVDPFPVLKLGHMCRSHFGHCLALTHSVSLSSLCLQLNKLDQAIEDCTKAIKLDETYIKAYLRRAQWYVCVSTHLKQISNFICCLICSFYNVVTWTQSSMKRLLETMRRFIKQRRLKVCVHLECVKMFHFH